MPRSAVFVRAYWWTVSATIVLAPVAAMLALRYPFRNLATEISTAAGVACVALFVLTLAMPSRLPSVLATFGVERVLRYHRAAALAGVIALAVHIGAAVIGDPRGMGIFDLPIAPRPVWAATASTLAFVLLVLLALRRRKAQPRYEGWRLAHVGLAGVGTVAAGLHICWLGSMIDYRGMRIAYFLLAEVALFVVLRRWIWLPLLAKRRGYVVDQVRAVPGNAVTVTVRAKGHSGLPFRAGQFAWLKIGSTPFVFEEHPFTIASTAERPNLKVFTIKALGDFSELLVGLRPGRRVYLDGPYGGFTVDRARGRNLVLIAGGVGVTPMVSMLSTLADRGDRGRHLLIVGARTSVDLIMRPELRDLTRRLNLRIIEVLSAPEPGWQGATGRIDATMLEWILGRRHRHTEYFVCGPPAMVATVGQALRTRGIRHHRIHTEQFEVV